MNAWKICWSKSGVLLSSGGLDQCCVSCLVGLLQGQPWFALGDQGQDIRETWEVQMWSDYPQSHKLSLQKCFPGHKWDSTHPNQVLLEQPGD